MIKLLLITFTSAGLGLVIAALAGEALPGLGALIVPALVIILLVIVNGLFVAAEFAIIGVRATQIEQIANEGNRIAQSVLKVLRSPEQQNRYIATAQLGITTASLGLGMYGEPQIAHFIEAYLARLFNLDPEQTIVITTGYLIAVSLLTYLHIVMGEMVPKSLALSAPAKAVLIISQPMHLVQSVLVWPVRFLNGIGNLLLIILRIPPAEEQGRLHSPEELELIVAESAEGGVLSKAEEEMIHNIFNFADRQVNQVMTPRPRVQAIAHDTPLPELLTLVTRSTHSRFPVYEANLDHIIGVLHIKDLVHQQQRQKGNFDIRLLLRPAPVVPEHYPVKKLLTAFKNRHIHIAVVLDEFGGTAGIVTLEDLVEEIVGEVRDEFDLENEPYIQLEPGVLEVAGDYLLDDLMEDVYLGEADDLPDVETVGGLIMAELGRLPHVGDQVTYNGVHFTVLTVDGLAVARARVEYPVIEESD